MLRSAELSCNEDNPCKHYDPCARCAADRYLTAEDWRLIGFYRAVADQVDGVTGMLRLEGVEAAARLHGYEGDLLWLVKGATLLSRLVSKSETVDWLGECGKSLRHIQPEDVI